MLSFLSEKLQIKNLKFHFFELCWRQCRPGNDFFYDLFFDCEEALTFFKFENVYQILKSISVENVAADHLSFYIDKVVPLRT